MSVTLRASALITAAYKMIGVIADSEVPTGNQQVDGLLRLNRMLDAWGIQRGTIEGISRSTYSLVAAQGGPSSPYVIGTGDQFNQARPVWIVDAAITQGSGTSLTEYPMLVVSTPQEYTAIVQKNVQSTIPTTLYYEGVTSGNVFLWPVPSSASYSIALYIPVAVTQFADYNTTDYTLADGCQKAIETNLALELLPEYPRVGQPDPWLVKMATESLAYIKRMNTNPGLLRCDPGVLADAGGYAPGGPNWWSGP